MPARWVFVVMFPRTLYSMVMFPRTLYSKVVNFCVDSERLELERLGANDFDSDMLGCGPVPESPACRSEPGKTYQNLSLLILLIRNYGAIWKARCKWNWLWHASELPEHLSEPGRSYPYLSNLSLLILNHPLLSVLLIFYLPLVEDKYHGFARIDGDNTRYRVFWKILDDWIIQISLEKSR